MQSSNGDRQRLPAPGMRRGQWKVWLPSARQEFWVGEVLCGHFVSTCNSCLRINQSHWWKPVYWGSAWWRPTWCNFWLAGAWLIADFYWWTYIQWRFWSESWYGSPVANYLKPSCCLYGYIIFHQRKETHSQGQSLNPNTFFMILSIWDRDGYKAGNLRAGILSWSNRRQLFQAEERKQRNN